jgi:acyl-CoA thioester hydrolase
LTRVRCPIHFDELDPNGHLHNTRYAVHVERATTSLLQAVGYDTTAIMPRAPDLHYVVRQFGIEFVAPFRGAGELVVDLNVQQLGRTSLVWAFACYDASGTQLCANGTRTIVKVDGCGRPVPWSAAFRAAVGLHGLRTGTSSP